MKRKSLLGIALAAAVTVACGGGNNGDTGNNTGNNDANQPNAIGTAGDDGAAGHGGTGAGDAAGGNTMGGVMGGGDVQGFVHDMAMHSMAEVELGRLASERAQHPQVKEFAKMMVKDHTKAGDELKSAVSRHNIQLAPQVDDDHKELMEKLRGLRGAEFDREYMEAMVDSHEDSREKLADRAERKQNDNATGNTSRDATGTTGGDNNRTAQLDMAVNQWAAKTLPAVEAHLQKAQQLNERVKNANTNNNRQ